ncbi:MAG: carbonate dehydratase [Burkholderiaceae bacterium]
MSENTSNNNHLLESMQERLFRANREWADSISRSHPGFFEKLAAQQTPDYLWIGCSDSRIPPNELLGLLPGDLFVHRNIANVVTHSDLNCLTVLQFAVDVLKVKHVIVCGHYGCGGVHAVLTKRRLGLVDNWLHHVEDVQYKHERYLGETLPTQTRLDRLCELNVMEQVANLCHTSIVRDAWERGQSLTLHSWVYGLKDGLLRDLGVTVSGPDDLARSMAQSLQRYREDQ